MSASDRALAATFSSRWTLLVAALGMAVGTGNIWRFPRIAATQGGGSFLVAWVVFLLLWSVPLLVVELAFGKTARRGTIGAFARMGGRGMAWMGGFVAVCATGIMFYYSVVTGWCFRFLLAAASGGLAGPDAPERLWQATAGSPSAVPWHLLAVALGVAVVGFGVRGIEHATRVLIPTLVVLVIVLAVRAVTLPGAAAGLEFLFAPRWEQLASPRIWLEALTQNAWDTGAGWGLLLTYAIYLRARDDVSLNAFVLGFGNNSMSLLAGIMVLCTVFAVDPQAEQRLVGADNTGLTFVWMPQLFATLPFGGLLMVVFFAALSCAALTSLIAMLELATRVAIDLGLERRRAVLVVGAAGALCGTPSALSMDVFNNQDWVWGVGLILSGLFFALAARSFGVERLRREIVNGPGSDLRLGRWWSLVIAWLVPIEALALLLWWLRDRQPGWLDPTGVFSVGTVLVQWAMVVAILLVLNRWLARRSLGPVEGSR
ncbi:MAG: sodium-dependent transporter [Acidobacteriota bacterium]